MRMGELLLTLYWPLAVSWALFEICRVANSIATSEPDKSLSEEQREKDRKWLREHEELRRQSEREGLSGSMWALLNAVALTVNGMWCGLLWPIYVTRYIRRRLS